MISVFNQVNFSVKMGIVEKIQEIEREISRTQKNKATEYHLGILKVGDFIYPLSREGILYIFFLFLGKAFIFPKKDVIYSAFKNPFFRRNWQNTASSYSSRPERVAAGKAKVST